MPLDLHNSVRDASLWAFGSPVLNGLLNSSLFLSGIISATMILLIMFMYPAKSGTSFSVVFKMFVYMYFITLGLLFLHDSFVRHIAIEECSAHDTKLFMQNVSSDPDSLYTPDPTLVSVKPSQGNVTSVQSPRTTVNIPTIVQSTEIPTSLPSKEVLGGAIIPKTNNNIFKK